MATLGENELSHFHTLVPVTSTWRVIYNIMSSNDVKVRYTYTVVVR